MGGIESLNNKLCKCQCSFLRRNSFQLTKRQQDHQQMRVLCDWHKHGETEVSSLKIYPCISPSVQSLFLCLYPSQSHPAQHAQTAPLSRTPRFTPLSLTSKPRTQRGTSRFKQCLPWFCGLMERLLLWVRIGEYVQEKYVQLKLPTCILQCCLLALW